MSALDDLIEADAAAAAELDGAAITYTQIVDEEPSDQEIYVVPRSQGTDQVDAAGNKINAHRVLISVPKASVAAPRINQDTATVPASWFRAGSSGTVSCRVAGIEGDDADPGSWLLVLRKN